ncbi:hypothetical protein [Beijerinckia indica]|uniref:Uncharacterized protein n=1 Tax=Beijerinckia indica subsp. indica (strain ATCC 9039 / DSM 1715 / NCIMB 8712) TaxID=395963 RepID=B2IBF2_BEII9|nr:hypothetical protein [Beijerinckia indica]ACB96578.1 hypothetical protein Bind_3016 [Beijerinckia indica subsp. indica ATCC 9039]
MAREQIQSPENLAQATEQKEAFPRDEYTMPAAGPHARRDLVNFDATPGCGILTALDAGQNGPEVDSGAG